jgi:hypothetical protein
MTNVVNITTEAELAEAMRRQILSWPSKVNVGWRDPACWPLPNPTASLWREFLGRPTTAPIRYRQGEALW